MKQYLKKIVSLGLSLIFLVSGSGISQISMAASSNNIDLKVETTPIRQLTNWCWLASAQMVLNSYLKNAGLIESENSGQIYLGHSQDCIDAANKYFNKTIDTEQLSLLEFDRIYNQKFINETTRVTNNFQDNIVNKEAAFLAYIGSDKLTKASENEIFSTEYHNVIINIMAIVLNAFQKTDCAVYELQAMSGPLSDIGWKIGFTALALKDNSPLITSPSGHFRVINGLSSNNGISIQETAGAHSSYHNLEYLNHEQILIFIDNNQFNQDTHNLKAIFKIAPDKIKENACYKTGDVIDIVWPGRQYFLPNGGGPFLLDENNTKYIQLKSSSDIEPYLGLALYQYIPLKFYQITIPESWDGVTVKELINNCHFEISLPTLNPLPASSSSQDSNNIPNSSVESSSSNSSSSSGSSSSYSSFISSSSSNSSGSSSSYSSSSSSSSYSSSNYSSSNSFKTKQRDTTKPLITYEYKSSQSDLISALSAINNALKDKYNLNNLKQNQTITFKTNKYTNGKKETLATWNLNLSSLKKDFKESYNVIQQYETKQLTNKLTEKEKQILDKAKQKISDYNFKLSVKTTDLQNTDILSKKVKQGLKNQKITIVDFSQNKVYPGEFSINLNMGKEVANKPYIVYYLDPKTNYSKLLKTNLKGNNKGQITFKSDHGAAYILIPNTKDNLKHIDNITKLISN